MKDNTMNNSKCNKDLPYLWPIVYNVLLLLERILVYSMEHLDQLDLSTGI